MQYVEQYKVFNISQGLIMIILLRMLIIINLDILYTNVETRIGLPAFFHPIVSNYPVQGFEPSQQQHMYPSRSIYSMVSFEGSNIQLEPSLTPIKEISPYKNG